MIEIPRSFGTFTPSPALVVDASDGATNLPDEFFTDAVVKLFWRAYASSTYPTAPVRCFTAAATPSLPLAPVPVGHLTVLSAPTFDFHSGLYPDRNVVKPFVVPDSSERWTTVIGCATSFTPGFSLAIAGSLQSLIFPRKMSAIVAPSSFRSFGSPLYETVMAPNAVGI